MEAGNQKLVWGVPQTSQWRCITDGFIYESGNQWRDSGKEYTLGSCHCGLQCLEVGGGEKETKETENDWLLEKLRTKRVGFQDPSDETS